MFGPSKAPFVGWHGYNIVGAQRSIRSKTSITFVTGPSNSKIARIRTQNYLGSIGFEKPNQACTTETANSRFYIYSQSPHTGCPVYTNPPYWTGQLSGMGVIFPIPDDSHTGRLPHQITPTPDDSHTRRLPHRMTPIR